MNPIDLGALILLLLFLISGALSGFASQLRRLLIWLFGILTFFVTYAITLNVFLSSLLMMASVIVINIFLWIVVRIVGIFKIRKPQTLSSVSRLTGALLAGFKGLIVIAILASFINILPSKFLERIPLFKKHLHNSSVSSFFCKHNLFLEFKVVENIYYALRITDEWDAMEYVHKQSAFREIMSNPRLLKVLQDEDLKRAFEKRQVIEVLKNRNFKMLFQDKGFLRQFKALDLKGAYEAYQKANQP